MSVDLLPTHTMINVDLLYAESEAKGQAVVAMSNNVQQQQQQQANP